LITMMLHSETGSQAREALSNPHRNPFGMDSRRHASAWEKEPNVPRWMHHRPWSSYKMPLICCPDTADRAAV
jgi:hypothetical protein